MRPPAEQLIRGYLNRLSGAARNRLPPDDRRAFVARTRDFIESQSGARQTADPAAVMRILDGLGEPEAAAEQEAARLQALRTDRAAAAARSGQWKPRAPGSPPGAASKARGGKDDAKPAAKPGPAPRPPKTADRQFTGEVTMDSRPVSARWKPGAPPRERQSRPHRIPLPRWGGSRPPAGDGQEAPRPGADQQRRTRTPVSGPAGALEGLVLPGPAAPPGPASGSSPPGQAGAAQGPVGRAPAAAAAANGAGTGQAPERGAAGDVSLSPALQPRAVAPVPARSPVPMTTASQRRLQLLQRTDVTRSVTAGVANAWRQHRLELIAVALLAIAGLIFPRPIWLVGLLLWLAGAGIALSSKLWSPVDKWVTVPGLAILLIVGTVVGVSLGGAHSHAGAYGHEALDDVIGLFRIGALLGAAYLAWRMHRGRRSPAVPPWVRRRHH
jgi:hypothetical protein